MTSNDTSPSNSTERIYKASDQNVQGMMFVGILIAMASLFFFYHAASLHAQLAHLNVTDESPSFVGLGIFCLGIGLFCVGAGYYNGSIQLAVSDRTIVYVTRSQTQAYAWKAAVELKKMVFTGRYRSGGTTQDLLVMDDGRKINLSLFGDSWRDGELGRQLKEYAPWLFVDR